jgi:hypothetical protein
MKLTLLIPVLACAAGVGCDTLPSLDRFVAAQDIVTDKALPGVWQNANGDDTYIIRQEGQGYSIVYMSGKGAPARFEAVVARLGMVELLDLVSADDNAFQIPAHHLVRVWVDGATLRWAFLDSDWMKEQAAETVPTRKLDDRLLITATPEAARALMWKHAGDERAFKEVETLTRVQ